MEKTPSTIAMMVVGGVLLIAYVIYEILWTRVPNVMRNQNNSFVSGNYAITAGIR